MHRALLSGVLRVSAPCRMRFDDKGERQLPPPPQQQQQQQKDDMTTTMTAAAAVTGNDDNAGSSSSSDSTARRPAVTYRSLPASMLPRRVAATFTPYPLPRHDDTLGFGPVRLRDVPDIAAAEQRCAQVAAEQHTRQTPSRAAELLQRQLDDDDDDGDERCDVAGTTARASGKQTAHATAVATAAMLPRRVADTMVADDAGDTHAVAARAHASVRGGNEDDAVRSSATAAADDDADDEGEDDALAGYRVGPHYPLIDRLECERGVDDLLRQFVQRPHREARVATVLDIAAVLPRCGDDELTRALHELSVLFAPDGNGLNFLVGRKAHFGLPYAVTSSLTDAYVHLVRALTDTLVSEQPTRLPRAPRLFAQLLHFLALLKVCTPNVWYAGYSNTPQNRANYTHPRGINTHTAHRCVGEALLDYMMRCVVDDSHADDAAAAAAASEYGAAGDDDMHSAQHSPLLRAADTETLLSMLRGFAAVMQPDGQPRGDVARALVRAIRQRWTAQCGGVLHTAHDVALLEQLYLTLQLMHYPCEDIRDALLWPVPSTQTQQQQQRGGGQPHTDPVTDSYGSNSSSNDDSDTTTRATPLRVAPTPCPSTHDDSSNSDGWRCRRGADFFAAVSRERSAAVRSRALELLHSSLAYASSSSSSPQDTQTSLLALCEAGSELLMMLEDTAAAARVARQYDMDAVVLQAMPTMQTVAQRLRTQQQQQQRSDNDDADDMAAVAVRHVQAALTQANVHATRRAHTANERDSRVVTAAQVRQPRVRTLLTSLAYLSGCDRVFLLHSSAVRTHVDELVHAVRRLRSGKDALVVSTSCLRALTARAHVAPDAVARHAARRALDVLSYELEKGRVVLVPLSEELRVHDGGVYCDEDLLLWTLAALCARELPLVKAHVMVHRSSPASRPYVHLKGPHSPLKSRTDLYNAHTPLLSGIMGQELYAVTAQSRLRPRVRDAATTLYRVSAPHARRVYRRDKAMFDRYHTTARHLAPGFSVGALASDQRGLGYYTPDHPQVAYGRVPLAKHVLPVTPSV